MSFAYPIQQVAEVKEVLKILKEEHPKAVHYCYAFRVGTDGNSFRAADDGEPSGTAGKPIYGQIIKNNLSNVLVVVIRYFGGTKLGIPGLINAYREATADGLSNANIISGYITKNILFNFDYEHMGKILSSLKENGIEIISKDFGKDCKILTKIRISQVEEKVIGLKADLLCLSTDEVDYNTKIDYFTICEVV